MNKTEFFEVVKAAGLDAKAVEDLEMDADGMVEAATIKVKNEAWLPTEIASDGCGNGLFYSRVRYLAGDEECWISEAGYEWNDSMTTAGDAPACEPAMRFASLKDAAVDAVFDAEEMAKNLQYEVEEALKRAGGQPIENYKPSGWGGFAYFDLNPVTEDVE